jgi:23S rRNA (uridine2479-2'-O)-methyltransferase
MRNDKVSRINGQFQQWRSLLRNRTKRTQTGKFIVQGVRPINAALKQSIAVDAILYREGELSGWASNILRSSDAAKRYELTVELMKLLSEKDEDVPELLLIAKRPEVQLRKVQATKLKSQFILVLDRPQNPGNIGAVVRSADALGAGMVVVTGHAADPYDSKSIRASRGSLFALPVITAESHSEVLEWASKQDENFTVLGLSEDGDVKLSEADLKVPTIAVIGNETWGLSKQWKEACTQIIVIPMQGTASSLNAASSAAIVMYEYSRQ